MNVSYIPTKQIVYSANLQYNLYRACYPWHMHYDWKIECWDAENVYTHTCMVYLLFQNFHFSQCHLVAQMAFWVGVPLVLWEVCWFLCASSVSADSLLCHFGMEGSRPYDFYNPLPGVFLSQPSPFYAQKTQLFASSLLGLGREVA